MTEKEIFLESNAMHRWLYSRKVDPVIVADRLADESICIQANDKDKTPFEEEQIRRLVYFMGAKVGFRRHLFCYAEERERVRKRHSERRRTKHMAEKQNEKRAMNR